MARGWPYNTPAYRDRELEEFKERVRAAGGNPDVKAEEGSVAEAQWLYRPKRSQAERDALTRSLTQR